MKTYVKPDFVVEEFMADTVVAACDRLPSGTEYTYTPQTVSCIVSSQDTIFTEGTNGCDHQVDPEQGYTAGSTVGNGSYFFYNHTEANAGNSCDPSTRNSDSCDKSLSYGLYYAWVGSSAGGGGGNSNRTGLEHLLSLVGIRSVNVSNNLVWHAGMANQTLTQLYSHSY